MIKSLSIIRSAGLLAVAASVGMLMAACSGRGEVPAMANRLSMDARQMKSASSARIQQIDAQVQQINATLGTRHTMGLNSDGSCSGICSSGIILGGNVTSSGGVETLNEASLGYLTAGTYTTWVTTPSGTVYGTLVVGANGNYAVTVSGLPAGQNWTYGIFGNGVDGMVTDMDGVTGEVTYMGGMQVVGPVPPHMMQ